MLQQLVYGVIVLVCLYFHVIFTLYFKTFPFSWYTTLTYVVQPLFGVGSMLLTTTRSGHVYNRYFGIVSIAAMAVSFLVVLYRSLQFASYIRDIDMSNAMRSLTFLFLEALMLIISILYTFLAVDKPSVEQPQESVEEELVPVSSSIANKRQQLSKR